MIDQRRTLAYLAGALLLFTTLPAIPQEPSAAPRGTYLKTCSQIHMEGKTLFATCDHPNSLAQRSTINVSLCDGDIWNQNGHLTCYARRGTWGQGRAIPRGSYTDTCENTIVEGTTLKTKCKARDGGYNEVFMDLKKCPMGSNIANIDGYPACIE